MTVIQVLIKRRVISCQMTLARWSESFIINYYFQAQMHLRQVSTPQFSGLIITSTLDVKASWGGSSCLEAQASLRKHFRNDHLQVFLWGACLSPPFFPYQFQFLCLDSAWASGWVTGARRGVTFKQARCSGTVNTAGSRLLLSLDRMASWTDLKGWPLADIWDFGFWKDFPPFPKLHQKCLYK